MKARVDLRPARVTGPTQYPFRLLGHLIQSGKSKVADLFPLEFRLSNLI